jgi:hypothetical protein
MSRYRSFSAVLCAAALTAACSDSQSAPTAPTAPAASMNVASTASAEQQTLNQIARALAMALNDQGLRQRIRNDMRHSPHVEHKLDFRDYLHGQSGGILLAKMAKQTGMSRGEVLALVGQVRPLEMYFPVDAHRESWTGGTNLQVLGHLNASGDPTAAYTLAGGTVPVAASTAPATPTLVIVQRETDFSQPRDPARVENVRDQGGQSIGTYSMIDCGIGGGIEFENQPLYGDDGQSLSCGGGGGGPISGGGPTTSPTPVRYRTSQGFGLREVMTEYKQSGSLDGWFQGDPEMYVEVTSHASSPGNPAQPYFTSKVRFGLGNDDSAGWKNAYLPHLISWNAEYGNYIHLKFYEDDGASLINFTITFQGKTYGINIPAEREDLGAWTYSFNDQSLVYGLEGHGAGNFGANNGAISFITDYRVY